MLNKHNMPNAKCNQVMEGVLFPSIYFIDNKSYGAVASDVACCAKAIHGNV